MTKTDMPEWIHHNTLKTCASFSYIHTLYIEYQNKIRRKDLFEEQTSLFPPEIKNTLDIKEICHSSRAW